MKWSPEIQQKLLDTIRLKMENGLVKSCPLCGNPHWLLADGFIHLIIQPELPGIVLGGQTLPSVALVCKRCGNTHLLNLIALGLAELVKPEPVAESKPVEAAQEK